MLSEKKKIFKNKNIRNVEKGTCDPLDKSHINRIGLASAQNAEKTRNSSQSQSQ